MSDTDLEQLRRVMLTRNVELRRCDVDCVLIGVEHAGIYQWVVFYRKYRSRIIRSLYRGDDLSAALEALMEVQA